MIKLFIFCALMTLNLSARADNEGKALTACKKEVKHQLGNDVWVRLKKFKRMTHGNKVILKVRQAGEYSRLHCLYQNQIATITNTEGVPIAKISMGDDSSS